ncbi:MULTISPECIES: hypothetical protein [Streptococcus]|nr:MULTISPECIES: hypothetical protein [Streptococcus]WNN31097.1 hypothetical protein RIN70_06740 [Streptococcus parasanguinis]
MKKKIKWGLVLCSVLIPVCLSACKQGTVEKQGSSNKEVQKKIDRKNIHFDKTGPAASFDWNAKSGNKYRTFDHDPSYMRSAPSDGISKYSLQQNEAPLDEEGKVQKALQVVEAIYIDQDEMDTVVKASGVMSQEEMYNRIWKDYIVPKIEESNRTFDSNTYFEYLGEKYPLKIYGPMYLKLMTNALPTERSYELKGYAVKGNKVVLKIQTPAYSPRQLPRGKGYRLSADPKNPNETMYAWLDELHENYAEKDNRGDHLSYIMLSTILQHLVKENFNASFSTGDMIGSTEMTIEMEVTNQGQVQIDTKNLALLLQIPQQMQKANQSGGGNDNSIFWPIITDRVTDEGKVSEKLKDFNPQNPVKKYAIGEPVVFGNGIVVTLDSVREEPNLDIQDDQEFVDKNKNQHKIIVQFTISNPTHLTVANTPDYTNVDLYDGQGKSAYMLNNTLNYKQPTVLEAGESGIYKINYLTDGDGPFTVVYGDTKWVFQK